MNKALLVGNLTKDPEISTTPNGVSVAKFSIAVNRRYQNAEGQRDTDFFNIVAWRGLADTCHKFLKKGSKVGIVGAIQTRTYDAQDGTKRYVTEIVADEVEFLSSKGAGSGESTSGLQPVEDDSLPF